MFYSYPSDLISSHLSHGEPLKLQTLLMLWIGDHLAQCLIGVLQPSLSVRDKSKGLQRCRPSVKVDSHISCSWECGRLQGNEPPHSQVSSHFRSWSPNGLPNLQRVILWVTMDRRVPYIIEKLFDLRCVNCQFDSRPLKVGNRPNFLMCRWHVTYCWKALNEVYNFALDLIPIEGLHTKLCTPKVVKVPTLGNFGTPIWESWDKMTFGC
jgi:hypothetical protein